MEEDVQIGDIFVMDSSLWIVSDIHFDCSDLVMGDNIYFKRVKAINGDNSIVKVSENERRSIHSKVFNDFIRTDRAEKLEFVKTFGNPIFKPEVWSKSTIDELDRRLDIIGCKRMHDRELPERYIINENATILFWKDGTKTIVKRAKEDKHDKALGFLTAYFQKHCGLPKWKANKYLKELKETENAK